MRKDLQPEIITLEDGALGYFYSLSQLEDIAQRRLAKMTDEQVRNSYGWDKGNVMNNIRFVR